MKEAESIIGVKTMTVLEQKPLTVSVPLWEDPPGVFRVGKSRVLLELVIRAYQRGSSPQDIVQMYGALRSARYLCGHRLLFGGAD